MINPAQQRDLTDLRAAAESRDHQQAQYLLKRLLQSLRYYAALAVVAERIYGFVDIFESYYPDEVWVRHLLVALASFGTAPDEGVAEMALQQAFDAPGCGNYIKAVYDLTQATQDKHTPEARVGFMASAIVNANMAEVVEAWYGERPGIWQQMRQAQASADTEMQAQLGAAFWLAEETAALDTACWLEVADKIEKALKR